MEVKNGVKGLANPMGLACTIILQVKLGVSDILLIKNIFVENMYFNKLEILQSKRLLVCILPVQ